MTTTVTNKQGRFYDNYSN